MTLSSHQMTLSVKLFGQDGESIEKEENRFEDEQVVDNLDDVTMPLDWVNPSLESEIVTIMNEAIYIF